MLTATQLAALSSAPAGVSKAKSSVPEPVLSAEQAAQVAAWEQAARDLTDAEARRNDAAGVVSAWSEPLRLAACGGRHAASVRLSDSVLWTVQYSYPAYPAALAQQLEKHFGAAINDYVIVDTAVMIDASRVPPDLLAQLVACGAVATVQTLKPTQKFHQELHTPAVAAVAALLGIKPKSFLTIRERSK